VEAISFERFPPYQGRVRQRGPGGKKKGDRRKMEGRRKEVEREGGNSEKHLPQLGKPVLIHSYSMSQFFFSRESWAMSYSIIHVCEKIGFMKRAFIVLHSWLEYSCML